MSLMSAEIIAVDFTLIPRKSGNFLLYSFTLTKTPLSYIEFSSSELFLQYVDSRLTEEGETVWF